MAQKYHKKLLKALLILLLAPLFLLGYEIFQAYYYSIYIKSQYISDISEIKDTEWKFIQEDIEEYESKALIRKDFISHIILFNGVNDTNIQSIVNSVLSNSNIKYILIINGNLKFNNSFIAYDFNSAYNNATKTNTNTIFIIPLSWSNNDMQLLSLSNLKNNFYKDNFDEEKLNGYYIISPLFINKGDMDIEIFQIVKLNDILTNTTKNYANLLFKNTDNLYTQRMQSMILTAFSIIILTIVTIIGMLYAIYIIIRWEKP